MVHTLGVGVLARKREARRASIAGENADNPNLTLKEVGFEYLKKLRLDFSRSLFVICVNIPHLVNYHLFEVFLYY